jgi:putative ABC transport system substrate-binding protein
MKRTSLPLLKRREFITLLGGAAALPVAARAQQSSQPVIGWLSARTAGLDADNLRAFRQGLAEAGFGNAAIEYGWAEGRSDRLPGLAADLVRRRVSVIASLGAAATRAAKTATTTIPIVFAIAADPVLEAFVASLNRPGGNLTGTTNLAAVLGPKRLELLHEAVPAATVVAVLVKPDNAVIEAQSRDLQAAARALGLQLQFVQAGAERDFEAAFATTAQLKPSALVIGTDAYFLARTKQLAALATRHMIPAIYSSREFAEAGGLIGYGASPDEAVRPVGNYVGRILKGEKPADLPVQQSTKVDLAINLKAAKALGLELPPGLLARADEVIE